jgi:hypothetical protein
MAITFTQGKIHWNYFIALERDMEVASRYIEFCNANLSVFSIELAHLLLASASEVDVVAKLLCENLAPIEPRGNIDHYRAILAVELPEITSLRISVPRYGLEFTPWET